MIKFISSLFKSKQVNKPFAEANNFETPIVVLKNEGYEIKVFKLVKALEFIEAMEEVKKIGGMLLGQKGMDIYRGLKRPEYFDGKSSLIYSLGETVEEMTYLLYTGEYYFFRNSEHLKINEREYVLVFIKL